MSDLINRMRLLELDHPPEGWPAVQTRDISALCDALEQAQARVAEMEAENKALRERMDNLTTALVSHIGWESEQPQMKAFILHKQAEAVESAIKTALRNLGNADLYEEDIDQFAFNYANHLRQQADELEKQQ